MGYRVRVIPKTKRRIMRAVPATDSMKTPYGRHIVESCLTCPMMKERLFCNLPPAALDGL